MKPFSQFHSILTDYCKSCNGNGAFAPFVKKSRFEFLHILKQLKKEFHSKIGTSPEDWIIRISQSAFVFFSLLPTILDYWKRASYKSSDRPISIMGLADTFGPRCLQLKVSFPFLLMLQMPSTNAKAQKCNLKRLLLIKFHSGDYAGTQGLGLLRLHSTYRHDLKIYASDEGKSWFDLRNTKIKRQVMGA